MIGHIFNESFINVFFLFSIKSKYLFRMCCCFRQRYSRSCFLGFYDPHLLSVAFCFRWTRRCQHWSSRAAASVTRATTLSGALLPLPARSGDLSSADGHFVFFVMGNNCCCCSSSRSLQNEICHPSKTNYGNDSKHFYCLKKGLRLFTDI